MNRPIRNFCAAGAALILAAGFSGVEAFHDAAARVNVRSLRERQSELADRLRAADREARAAQRLARARQRAAADEAMPLMAVGSAPLSASAKFRGWLAAHPEARSHYLQAYREGLSTSWGLLIHALNLAPNQADELEDLIAQREDNDIEVAGAAQEKGLPLSAPEIQALDDQLDQANKDAIRSLVGKGDYPAVHQYMHDEDVLPLVDDLAGGVYETTTPLTADQGMQLIQILADSSKKTESGGVIEDTVNWTQAMSRAQSVLSPAQLGTLTLIEQQNQSAEEIRRLEQALP